MTLTTDTELAALFGVSREYVQDKCRTKTWPHMRVGRRYRFTPEQIEAVTALQPVPAARTVANTWGRKGRNT